MSYAVIETGGKQYRVTVGQAIEVEKLDGDVGDVVTLGRVLLVAGEGNTSIGTPVVEGAAVKATIDAQHKADKVIVFKMKAKKRYRRLKGHRQQLTRLTVTDIVV
ncbi:MAG: 50S ribosomal protein L21 [Thermomicrobiales bacterium]